MHMHFEPRLCRLTLPEEQSIGSDKLLQAGQRDVDCMTLQLQTASSGHAHLAAQGQTS